MKVGDNNAEPVGKTYLLTMRFRFEASDDVEARKEMKKMMDQYEHVPGLDFKLQEPREGKPPRGIWLDNDLR